MTLCDLVSVFAETKSVTKSRLHCTQFLLQGQCQLVMVSNFMNEFWFTLYLWKKYQIYLLWTPKNNFFHNKILKISSQSVWQLHLHDNNSMNNLNSSSFMRSDISCQKYDVPSFGSVKQRCRDLKTKGLFLLD